MLALAGSIMPAAYATTVSWADWTSATSATVSGAIGSVNVTYSGAVPAFTQLNNIGTFFWTQGTPAPYTSGSVSNAPATADIIALNNAGTSTITFSQPVVNPYLALVSWNAASVTAGDSETFTYISSGSGAFGSGMFAGPGGTGAPTPTFFTGAGELHGIFEIPGTWTSISFTDTTTEFWHGLTVGIGGVASTSPVPEPATGTLTLVGFGLLSVIRLRKKKG
jgi:hypothetical protein